MPKTKEKPKRTTADRIVSLKPKDKAYIKEYLSNGNNGTQAVLATHKDIHSTAAAGVQSSRLLSNDKIKNEIIKALPSLDQCAADFEKAKRLALKKSDLSNFNRSTENQVRMQGGFKDESGAKVAVIVSVEDRVEVENIRRRLE